MFRGQSDLSQGLQLNVTMLLYNVGSVRPESMKNKLSHHALHPATAVCTETHDVEPGLTEDPEPSCMFHD